MMLALLPSFQEILPILLIVLLLFGAKKIPELMRGFGQGIREFNSARAQVKEELEKGMNGEENSDTSSQK